MSSNITNETAIITLEVELVSSVKGNPIQGEEPAPFLSDVGDDLRDIINEEVNSSIKDAIDDTLAEEGIDVEKLKDLTNTVKDLDGKAMGNIQSFARNPENFMENTIINTLARAGPYGALAAAIITTIAGTPQMVAAVVEALGVKGGPINQDYRYSQEEQYNQQFDRRLQFRRLTGDDPVITLQSKGFVVGDPDFVDNSLVDTNVARTGRVNLRQSSLGYLHGI